MYRTIIVIIFLVISSVYDVKFKRLPMWLMWSFACFGGIFAIFVPICTLGEIIKGVLIGVLLIVVSLVTRGQIGFGDGLLFVVLGIFIGGNDNLNLLMLSLLLCAAAAGMLFVTKQLKGKDRLPFAPFVLCANICLLLVNM